MPMDVEDIAQASVSGPPALSLTPTDGGVECNGDSDAVVSVSVSGGTMPYQYNWSSASSNSDATA